MEQVVIELPSLEQAQRNLEAAQTTLDSFDTAMVGLRIELNAIQRKRRAASRGSETELKRRQWNIESDILLEAERRAVLFAALNEALNWQHSVGELLPGLAANRRSPAANWGSLWAGHRAYFAAHNWTDAQVTRVFDLLNREVEQRERSEHS